MTMSENIINNKSLSIRVCSNGLSFCTYAPGSEVPFEYVELDVNHTISLAANLKSALLTEPMLKADYQRVNVLISTPKFTTVPVVAFDKESMHDMYGFVFPKDRSRHVSYNVLRRSGLAIIFGMDKNIYQLLLDDFPRARFYASSSTLIEFFCEKSLIGIGRRMYAYLHGREMTVYAFNQGHMLVVNTFEVATVNDMQYFILNVWEQLGFDQVKDALAVVSDDAKMGKTLVEKIRHFILYVDAIDRADDFKDKLTKGYDMIPYDLQTLLVCGF